MILAFQYTNADHAYENECPAVSPMSDFDVEKVNDIILLEWIHF